jgi:single-strand DNA-binding protein
MLGDSPNAGDAHGCGRLTVDRTRVYPLFYMHLNKVFVLGNLTKDPELRSTSSGQSVCTFGLATNRFYTTGEGKKEQQVEFHTIVAWGKQAELIHQYSKKGSMLLVEGRLQRRDWTDDKGMKHWRTEIVAERLQLGPRMTKKAEPISEIITDPAEEAAAQPTPVVA